MSKLSSQQIVQQKISDAVCQNLPRYKLFVIYGQDDDLLRQILRQFTLPFYVPGLEITPNQFQETIKKLDFYFLSKFIPSLETDMDKFLVSLEMALQLKDATYSPNTTLYEFEKSDLIKNLAIKLDSVGPFIILLKDFHIITDPKIKEVLSSLIMQTHKVHWLIMSKELLKLPNHLEFIWQRQIYSLTIDHNLMGLTRKQYDYIVEIVNGSTVSEVAEKFGVKQTTLETRKWRIMNRLDIETPFQLVDFAIQHGLKLNNH